MKKITGILLFIIFCSSSFAQNIIEGNSLLALIGKPISDPFSQQFRQQEGFPVTSDNWNSSFTVYTDYGYEAVKKISLVQLLNGQKKFQSEERYGYYRKQLPLQLSWQLSRSACEARIGSPVKIWPSSPTTFDYAKAGWKIRIEYENNLPVMMNFQKDADYKPISSNTPIKADTVNGLITVNWPAFKTLITSCNKLNLLSGKDSVDYYGQVYYATPYKVDGFLRTAIKHIKKTNEWYYEAYLKPGSDSEKVRKVFGSLYREFKQVL